MAERRGQACVSGGDRRQELLDLLLRAVKKCQEKFGERSELATDYNEEVADLCLRLEMIFQHGLKTAVSSLSLSVLKNVADLVSNNFSSPTDGSQGGMWRVVRPVLNKHELEREVIRNILLQRFNY